MALTSRHGDTCFRWRLSWLAGRRSGWRRRASEEFTPVEVEYTLGVTRRGLDDLAMLYQVFRSEEPCAGFSGEKSR